MKRRATVKEGTFPEDTKDAALRCAAPAIAAAEAAAATAYTHCSVTFKMRRVLSLAELSGDVLVRRLVSTKFTY